MRNPVSCLLLLAVAAAPAMAATTQFSDSFSSLNTSVWNTTDAFQLGRTWLNDPTKTVPSVSGGYLNLSIVNGGWNGAQVRSYTAYAQGRSFTCRMKAAPNYANSGMTNFGYNTNFFLYANSTNKNPWNEIDFEFAGEYNPSGVATTAIHTNIFASGGSWEADYWTVDPSAGFNNWTINWWSTGVQWLVGTTQIRWDGTVSHIPTYGMNLFSNSWVPPAGQWVNGGGSNNWLNNVTAQIDSIQVTY